MKTSLTAERLRAVLHFDPDTGKFTRKMGKARRWKVGEEVGFMDKGYIRIGVDGEYYNAQRLAWLYVHGEWPSLFVDHINCDPSDNRIANLRLATRQQNRANSKSSKPKGVVKAKNRWQAQITINGRNTYLGSFRSPEEAAAAYDAAARESFGDFARSNYQRGVTAEGRTA